MNFTLPSFNFTLPKSTIFIASSLLVAVVLLLSLLAALGRGKADAQSEAVYKNAQAAAGALEFFYSDQNRYPTAEEFADAGVMGRYLKIFPLAEFSGNNCPNSFVYKRPTPTSYQLDYCLIRSYQGHAAGWNQLSQNH